MNILLVDTIKFPALKHFLYWYIIWGKTMASISQRPLHFSLVPQTDLNVKPWECREVVATERSPLSWATT